MPDLQHRRIWGGGPGGPWPPPGKISKLGRTEIGAWQDRNGSLAGQKLELGRTEMEAWQIRIGKLEA